MDRWIEVAEQSESCDVVVGSNYNVKADITCEAVRGRQLGEKIQVGYLDWLAGIVGAGQSIQHPCISVQAHP